MRILSFVGLLLLFSACDKNVDPFDVDNPGGGGPINPGAQKVLLEDLTGFRCTNCPAAADKAQFLSEIYGDQLVVVGIHCSVQFAEPTGDTPEEPFFTEFRTSSGTAYWEAYGSPGLPRGMLNRREFDGIAVIPPVAWEENIVALFEETAKAAVEIDDLSYDATSREVTFDVNMATADGLEAGSYFLNIYLTEDSIVDWQAFPFGEQQSDYVHRHVLRDNINGTWGDLAFDSADPGQENTLSYQYTIDEAWKEEHCEIIAYIYHGDTREIVQVDKHLVMNE